MLCSVKLLVCLAGCFSFAFAAFDTSTCGVTKTCVRSTSACSQTDATCLFFSYAWNSTSSTFAMELSGGTGAGSRYVGVAFSPTGNMLDSDLYICLGTEFRSGVIRERSLPTMDANLPAGITNEVPATTNGVAECTFTRVASISKIIRGGVNQAFNLATTNYFVLLADGPFSNGGLTYHGTNNRFPSSMAFDFVMSGSQATTASPSTAAAEMTTAPTVPDPLAGCDTSMKGCFRNPSTCTPGTSSCMFASWTYTAASNTFDFQLIGGTNSPGQYVSIAFGTSRLMSDADLYYCSATQLTSGAIRARRQAPTNLSTPPGLINVVTGTNNGILSCSFTRPASVVKELSNGSNVNFDLSTTQYYLLYAVGQTGSGGALSYHGQTGRTASESTFDFKNDATRTIVNANAIKLQVMFFVVAWIAA